MDSLLWCMEKEFLGTLAFHSFFPSVFAWVTCSHYIISVCVTLVEWSGRSCVQMTVALWSWCMMFWCFSGGWWKNNCAEIQVYVQVWHKNAKQNKSTIQKHSSFWFYPLSNIIWSTVFEILLCFNLVWKVRVLWWTLDKELLSVTGPMGESSFSSGINQSRHISHSRSPEDGSRVGVQTLYFSCSLDSEQSLQEESFWMLHTIIKTLQN
jgi:hypothetical protein